MPTGRFQRQYQFSGDVQISLSGRECMSDDESKRRLETNKQLSRPNRWSQSRQSLVLLSLSIAATALLSYPRIALLVSVGGAKELLIALGACVAAIVISIVVVLAGTILLRFDLGSLAVAGVKITSLVFVSIIGMLLTMEVPERAGFFYIPALVILFFAWVLLEDSLVVQFFDESILKAFVIALLLVPGVWILIGYGFVLIDWIRFGYAFALIE
jgi:hypothetical protein